jgi:hypothetical protein
MPKDTSLDLLQELSSGEDEFDVDLMACGCRLLAPANLQLSIDDIVRLYELGEPELKELIGALIDEASIPSEAVFRLASKVAEAKATTVITLTPAEETIIVEPISDASSFTAESLDKPNNPPVS